MAQMGKIIKISLLSILIIIVGIFLIATIQGLMTQSQMEKNLLSHTESKVESDPRDDLEKVIEKLNSELPRKVGDMGSLESIKVIGDTIFYNMKVEGNLDSDKYYQNNYDNMRNLLKYGILMMNSQRGNGYKLTNLMEKNKVGICMRVTTPSNKQFQWYYSGDELNDFMKNSKENPKEAALLGIQLQLEMVNMQTPIAYEGASVQTNLSGTVLKQLQKDYEILNNISLKENNIIYSFTMPETEYTAIEFGENLESWGAREEYLKDMCSNPNFTEFLNLLVIPKCNLVIKYKGIKTGEIVEVKFPYEMLRLHCTIPSNMLDKN